MPILNPTPANRRARRRAGEGRPEGGRSRRRAVRAARRTGRERVERSAIGLAHFAARRGFRWIRAQGGDNADGRKAEFQFFGQIRFGHEVEAAHLRAPLLEHARFGGRFAARAFIAQIDHRPGGGQMSGQMAALMSGQKGGTC